MTRHLTRRQKDYLNRNDFIYCPTCGRHWVTILAMGQWMATCMTCDERVRICEMPGKCSQLMRQMVETGMGN